jgi:Sulfotransferase family
MFSNIEKVCMFIGYPRSGHSLVGSLIDSHDSALIAHELNILKLVSKGMDQQKIFESIVNFTDKSKRRRKKWAGYSYEITDSWQGKYDKLTVIGDKKGGGTSRGIMKNPELIDQLIETFDNKLKFVHVIRNPYDIITTQYSKLIIKTKKSFLRKIDEFFIRVSVINEVKSDGRIPVYDFYHEKLISNPEDNIKELCEYLSLECSEKFLENCTNKLFTEPRKSRFNYKWTDEQIEMVAQGMKKYEHLNAYSYDS